MSDIYELTGQQLADLIDALRQPGVYSVFVAIDGGLKVKINHGIWSLPIGAR